VAGVGYDWRMASGQRQAALELTIGVVGSADLVERITLSGTATSGTGVATSPEVDALERSLRRAASGADGWPTTPFILDLTLRKK
jgi:hypothetical protein